MNIFKTLFANFAAKPPAIKDNSDVVNNFTPIYWDQDPSLFKDCAHRDRLIEVESDPEIAQCTQTRVAALVTTPYSFEYDPKTSKSERAIFEKCFDKIAVAKLSKASMTAIFYGIVVPFIRFENGKITQVKQKKLYNLRVNEKFEVVESLSADDQGNRLTPENGYFPLINTPTERNPYGESLYAKLFTVSKRRLQLQSDWAAHAGTFSVPPMHITMAGDPKDIIFDNLGNPVQDSDGKPLTHGKSLLATFMNGFRKFGLVVTGEGIESKFVQPVNSGQTFPDYDRVLTTTIQRLLLGQTATSNLSQAGSYGAAEVLDRVRDDLRQSDTLLNQEFMQSVINYWWWAAKYKGDPPVFARYEPPRIDKAIAERDKILIESGIVKGFTKEYVAEQYGIKEKYFIPSDDNQGGDNAESVIEPTASIQ